MPALALDPYDAAQDLSTAVASFLDACVLRNPSPKTVEWYRYCLGVPPTDSIQPWNRGLLSCVD